MSEPTPPIYGDRILSMAEVCAKLHVSRSTLWRLYAVYGVLDAPIQISPMKVGYRKSTIDAYMAKGCPRG